MSFSCLNCKKIFKRKDYLEKHKQRKYPCKRANILNMDDTIYKSCIPNVSFLYPKCIICYPNINNEINPSNEINSIDLYCLSPKQHNYSLQLTEKNKILKCDNSDKNDEKTKFKCNYCMNSYKYKQNKYRHIKDCIKKKEYDKEARKIQDIIDKLEEIKNTGTIHNESITNGVVTNESITNGVITNGSINNEVITNVSTTNVSTTNESIRNEDRNINKYNINNLKCEYCKKEFKYKTNKYRHVRICKEKTKKDDKKYKVKLLLEELGDNKSLVISDKSIGEQTVINNNNNNNNNNNYNNNSNNTNNTNNTIINNLNTINVNNTVNNNINININAFGNENLESIKEKDILYILNGMFMSFSSALTKIHYNIPENRNFCLPNKSDRKYISYYNGKNRLYEPTIKFKDKLCLKIMNQLEKWFEIHQKKLLKRKKDMLITVFDKFYDGKLDKKYYQDIETFLLSYSTDMKEFMNNSIKKIKETI